MAGSARHKGLVTALTLALALWGAAGKPGPRGIIVVSIGIAACLIYAFGDWAWARRLTPAEKIGRTLVLLLLSAGTATLYGWQYWPTGGVSSRGFMQVGETSLLSKEIKAGDRLQFRIWLVNKGAEPLEEMHYFVRLSFIYGGGGDADKTIHAYLLRDALKTHVDEIDEGYKGLPIGKGEGVWFTPTIPDEANPPLTQEQVRKSCKGN